MKLLSQWKQKQHQSKQERQQQKEQLSAQSLIPLKFLDNDVFITDDYQAVKILKVSSLNLELMSNFEMNEVLEGYETFLRTLNFSVQTTIVSQPIDLNQYVQQQRKLLERTTNPYKRELLEGYVEYLRSIELSQSMIQRQRYIVFSEQISSVTKEAYNDAIYSLENKHKHIKSGLEEIGLEVKELIDMEIIRYFQTLYNYSASQYRPIQETIIPLFTMGVKNE